MQTLKVALVTLCISLIAVACGQSAEPAVQEVAQNEEETTPTEDPIVIPTEEPQATYTAQPTYTPLPTHTALPTYTPLPTETKAPTATKTPRPTNTPMPTNTPRPKNTAVPAATNTSAPPTATEQPAVEGELAIVASITDGDTIRVLIDGQEYSVRLIGIDTPEYNEACGTEATQALASLIQGREVRLVKDVSETDQYNRLLRYIYVGDFFINAEMVRNGYAEAVRYPPDTAQAAYLESQAASAPIPSCQTVAQAQPTEPPPPTSVPQPTEPPAPAPTEPPPSPPTEPPPPPVAAGRIIIIAVNKRDEYVDIQNVGAADIDLGGWNLVSEKGNQGCGLGGIIAAGQIWRIWAMAEDAGQGGFNCGHGSNIWNNSEHDPAVLYDNTGAEVARK